MSESNSKDIKWMYDGPKSLVNREDYLLGKRIDKNFELFSDVVVKQKDEDKTELFEHKTLQPSVSSKTTVLDLGIVRNEDPLVAIRVREEQRKRALLENPLLKLKAQKLLKKEYEKEMRKLEKKKKGKKRSRSSSSSSSSSSSAEPDREAVKQDARHDHRSHEKSRKKFVQNDRRSREKSEHEQHRRSHNSESKTSREHVVGNREDERKERDRRRHEHRREEHGGSTSRKSGKPSTEDNRKPASSTNQPRQEKRPRLTAEEMEAKRKAMMANAKWRDDVREETIEIVSHRLRKEEEEQEKSKNLPLKPLIGSITSASASVEERIRSKKQNLQRSHDYMERSFAKK